MKTRIGARTDRVRTMYPRYPLSFQLLSMDNQAKETRTDGNGFRVLIVRPVVDVEYDLRSSLEDYVPPETRKVRARGENSCSMISH